LVFAKNKNSGSTKNCRQRPDNFSRNFCKFFNKSLSFDPGSQSSRFPVICLYQVCVWKLSPTSVSPSETLPHKYCLSPPPIRALYGPGLPLRTPLFRNYVQKTPPFSTLFLKNDFTQDLRQTERLLGAIKRSQTPLEGKTQL
jgi:hypothetical protein